MCSCNDGVQQAVVRWWQANDSQQSDVAAHRTPRAVDGTTEPVPLTRSNCCCHCCRYDSASAAAAAAANERRERLEALSRWNHKGKSAAAVRGGDVC